MFSLIQWNGPSFVMKINNPWEAPGTAKISILSTHTHHSVAFLLFDTIVARSPHAFLGGYWESGKDPAVILEVLLVRRTDKSREQTQVTQVSVTSPLVHSQGPKRSTFFSHWR